MTRFGPVAVFLIAAAPPAVLSAQERVTITPRVHAASSRSPANTVNLRFDVRLVQVPVVVTDARDKPVLDLTRESFRLFEDERERAITSFAVADSPISVAIVFDSSRSMKNKMAEARAGVEQFLDASMPGDEFSLVRFSDKAQVVMGFTRRPEDIARGLSFVEPRGWTALFDAMMLGAQVVRKGANQRKVLVVFSDGGDNNSRYSEGELAALLRERDVKVYALSIVERSRALDRLADETGGRAFWVRNVGDLPAALETLSRQMRSEYLVGYSPGELVNDGKYHRIRVEVQPPPGMPRVHASWRRGYTAPGD